MKTIIAIALLFATQGLCQSHDEVIDEYIPVLRRHYDDVLTLHTKVTEEHYENLSILTSMTYKIQNLLLRDQLNEKTTIKVATQKIIDELGLTSWNMRVRSCVRQSNENVNELITRSWGGEAACDASIMEKTKKAINDITMEYDRIISIHNQIQDSGRSCAGISGTPAQMRNCMTFDLMVTHVKTIEELRRSSERIVNSITAEFQHAASQLEECSSNVRQVIINDAESITAEFRQCAMAILAKE